MQPAVLVRLRPLGPWRYGPGDGGQNRVDTLFRSDRLFSAFTLAAQQLGWLAEWLDATVAGASPAVALSSLFPFQGDTLFVTPPATLWPPPAWLVTSPTPVFLNKVRWNMAQFAPLQLVESILLGQKILADQWVADAGSNCLLRRDRPSTSPFRTVLRTGAAVDRTTGRSAHAHTHACVEFEPGAGLWFVIRFRDESAAGEWRDRVRAILRLLGDSGFGARRTAGLGQTQPPELQGGHWPHLLFPKLARLRQNYDSQEHWMLSLFSPGQDEIIDWTKGDYSLIERGSAHGKRARFVAEGSVLVAKKAPAGVAVDVNVGASHPVYRSGIALALALPVIEPEAVVQAVEPPTDIDAPEQQPCLTRPDEPVADEQPPAEPPLEASPVEEPAIDEPPVEEPPVEEPPVEEPPVEEPPVEEPPVEEPPVEEPPIEEPAPNAQTPEPPSQEPTDAL